MGNCVSSKQRVLEQPQWDANSSSTKLGGSSGKSDGGYSEGYSPPTHATSRAGPPPPRHLPKPPPGRNCFSLDLQRPPPPPHARASQDGRPGVGYSCEPCSSGAADVPRCTVGAADVAALLREVHVGSRTGQCGRSPLYTGVWRQRRVSIMVSEHLVSTDDDVRRLQAQAAAAANSPALEHPNLVQVLASAVQVSLAEGADACGDGGGGEEWPRRVVDVWAVMEHCKQGSLEAAIGHDCLKQWPARDAPPNLRHILLTARDIASALAHLHRHGMVQGQLDSSCVHLGGAVGGDPRCFQAKVSTACHFCFDRDPFGSDTLAWEAMPACAPEVLMNGERHSPATNAWSFGVILWEMLTGTLASNKICFSQMMRTMLAKRDMLPPLPASCPRELQALVSACLGPDPVARPSFPAILAQLEALQAGLVAAQ
ncbi:hypothetical protein CHLNCDRAFT_53532 [Chlorella variabilis]|uniref:Protein kinase domain-containing protein n=1 Tax=Chlorella variabilis TaxID=554065 RepID=E1ZK63_CHLVA|nr:hypothetical protein CHLNCDRAFT_53532 [Chlorella variabilis]EFN53639.1 hypothetical protein CHLNCDRAFT_53532 [Chlorella variabilis]|eukprot:XP_005845741.1 hypothetical protein CHLNCDRAFT_53532 [Chlorella variabilis]